MPHDIERVFSSTLGMLPPCYDKEGHRVGALLHAFSGEDERRLRGHRRWIPYPNRHAYDSGVSVRGTGPRPRCRLTVAAMKY